MTMHMHKSQSEFTTESRTEAREAVITIAVLQEIVKVIQSRIQVGRRAISSEKETRGGKIDHLGTGKVVI